MLIDPNSIFYYVMLALLLPILLGLYLIFRPKRHQSRGNRTVIIIEGSDYKVYVPEASEDFKLVSQ